MKKTFLTSAIVALAGIGLMAGNAMADPVYGTQLQTTLDSMTQDGTFTYDVNTGFQSDATDSAWTIVGPNATTSIILFEFAGYAGTNSFGIYDLNDTSNMLTLFDGAAAAGAQSTLYNTGNTFTVAGGASSTFSSDNFGYFLNVAATGNVYFSDTSLNADGQDHMLAYQGDHSDNFDFNGDGHYTDYNSDTWIMAWEDLYGAYGQGSDRDFTDFVVAVSDVQPIPEPATMLLFGTGLAGLAGASRRRKKAKA